MSNFSEMVKLEAHLRKIGVRNSEDWARVFACGSHDEALQIIMEFVEVE